MNISEDKLKLFNYYIQRDLSKAQKYMEGLLKEEGFKEAIKTLKTYIKFKGNDTILSQIFNLESIKDFIIFETDSKFIENINVEDSKEVIFPFNNIFISYPFFLPQQDKVLFSNGMFLFKTKEYENTVFGAILWVCYDYIKGGITGTFANIQGIKLGKDGKFNFGEIIDCGLKYKETSQYSLMLPRIMKKLLYSIEKKEYTSYKKYINGKLETKNIIYAHEVSSHKRHFWEDSGKFKIPLMSKEEILSKGYYIDELVYKDGELRRDVPYIIIGNYKVDGEKNEESNNRKIELISKRILRKEQELYNLLIRLFPSEFIKRHDRKAIKPLELDFYIRELKLAFEYDGEQHYDKEICENVFHSDFEELNKRDRKKDVLCRDIGIRLIRIKYDEPITYNYIKRRIKNAK